MASQEKTKGEVPRYRLTEKAYIDDVLYDPEAQNPNLHEVNYEGIPGHHMEPVNEPARLMKEKHPGNYVDPIEAMTNIRTGTENTALVDFAAVLAQAISQANTARAHA